MPLRRVLLLAALPVSLLSVPAAHAFTPTWAGRFCEVTPVDDPTAPPGTRTAELSAGPIVGYDADSPGTLSEVYIFCTVQEGGTGYASDPDVAAAETEGYEFAMLPPTKVQWQSESVLGEVACTEIWISTPDGHLTVYIDPESGVGFSSPGDAHCG